MFEIRAYTSDDLEDLYRICLLTGDSGQDASAHYKNPKLLGHYYAAPYAIHEPELTFLLTDQEGVCGYVLGTKDSRAFANFINNQWLPPLQNNLPEPQTKFQTKVGDDLMLATIQRGYPLPEFVDDYPAHLHIDLLPKAQHQGMGKKLIQTFLQELKNLNIPGVHLGVSNRNSNAIGFYEHLGFQLLTTQEFSSDYGLKLWQGT